MSYVEGFVIPVPSDRQAAFIDHADKIDAVFMENGARRVVEGWGDNVPHGQQTDFYRAVDASAAETVAFSWIEWPDKAAADAVHGRMEELSKTDPRCDWATNPPPFDGKRMIYGGFEPILDVGESPDEPYIQGFVVPVFPGKREAYRAMAAEAAPFFMDHGARRIVETFESNVPDGKLTDFRRAVALDKGEHVVFSWIEWDSRESCEAAQKAMESDERMKMPAEMPFDAKRMIFAGFLPVVTLGD